MNYQRFFFWTLNITTFCHSVNLEQLAMAFICFLISQLSSGMCCLILPVLVVLLSLREKFRALPLFRHFLLIYTFFFLLNDFLMIYRYFC